MYAVVNRTKNTPVFSWCFDRWWEGPTFLVDLPGPQTLRTWFVQHVRNSTLPGDCILARQGTILAFARHSYRVDEVGAGFEFRRVERYFTTVYTPAGWLARMFGYQWQVRNYFTVQR